MLRLMLTLSKIGNYILKGCTGTNYEQIFYWQELVLRPIRKEPAAT